ncbi:MAG TPA: ATP-binding protein [Phycisphaerae bacterium]|nr:ATP-binding protein [Phycisphaerae bacterium]HRW53531.1 ATP-binding protein [Phycisphaerae bacterium]
MNDLNFQFLLTRRIAALLGVMCLPVAAAAVFCLVIIDERAHSYALLNCAGSQIARIERHANYINHTLASILLNDWDAVVEYKQRAHAVARDFEYTHDAIRNGGMGVLPSGHASCRLPAPADPQVIAALDLVFAEWKKTRDTALQALRADSVHLGGDVGFRSFQQQTQNSITAMTQAMLQLQERGESQLRTLRNAIALSVAATLACLLATIHFLRSRIIRPFSRSENARRRIVEELARQTDIATDLARKAESANVAKSAFLTNMSHELRTPLTAMLGFVDVLADNLVRRENIETIDTIRRNGRQLLTIIEDILDLSQIESGDISIRRQAVAPVTLISDCLSFHRQSATQRGLSLDAHFDDNTPATVCTDARRLRQVLLNIVGNAIKFTKQGGVTVTTRLERNDSPRLIIDVRDTGIGMTRQQIAGLFHPFSQADESLTRAYGGTGMGLLLSKRVAEALGGDVEIVESTPGAGSLVRVSIGADPHDAAMDHDETAAPPTGSPPDSPAPDIRGLRILLTEDGVDNQRLIAHMLRRCGAEVSICDNGQQGLDAALAGRDCGAPFDVILMDMQMPVMDGYEAARQLRRRDYKGPIIALTAHAMTDDRRKCLEAGCDDYATKPISRSQLMMTITRWTRQVPGVSSSEGAPMAATQPTA